MQFSSLPFLIWFVPIVFGLYFVLPRRFSNGLLLAASLVFYGWTSPNWLFLIGFECLAGYGFGLLLERSPLRWKRPILLLGCTLILALLFWFKYYNFFAGIVQSLFGVDWLVRSIVLPAGISFYTFQTLSYLIDIERGQAEAQHSFIDFCLYICMFFQLVAGPIVRYTQIEGQLKHRPHSAGMISTGVGRFVCGLSKKILIADPLAAIGALYRTSAQPSVLSAWLYALSTALFIYYDFSGYSDMAIGLGQMAGFTLPENFRYPFLAGSFTDFWRRWHMSLTAWFRDYVYIPMGGNRKGRRRQVFNLLVVWMLTGLWHGAAWTFVVWGLLFFVLLCLEKFILPASWIRSPIYRIVFIVGILLSFVLFYDDSLAQFGFDLQTLFGLNGLPLINAQSLYVLLSNLRLLLLAIAGCFPIWNQLWHRMGGSQIAAWVKALLQGAVLILCLAWLVSGSWSPFLYFRF